MRVVFLQAARGLIVALGVVLLAAWIAHGVAANAPAGHDPAPAADAAPPATAPPAATQAASVPASGETDYGPDVVMLKELVNQYEPVPFDHKGHARMAEMGEGCVTCHHRPPLPEDDEVRASRRHAEARLMADEDLPHDQAEAGKIPACKSCHPAEVTVEKVDVKMPGLKGAYHRQCLNCHRDWMHANACTICHEPRGGKGGGVARAATNPTADDIVGRMHPPIRAQDVYVYQARYMPADGPNVAFRHKEHTEKFGLKCVACHRKDSCSHCHDRTADPVAAKKPVKPGLTWKDSHGPCMSCHQQDRCQKCHYAEGQAMPAAFEHRQTGQLLDKDHEKLACVQCHAKFDFRAKPVCGNGACHPKAAQALAFPAHRPGPVLAKAPDPPPTTRRVLTTQPTPQPTTRATIVKIRRTGGAQ